MAILQKNVTERSAKAIGNLTFSARSFPFLSGGWIASLSSLFEDKEKYAILCLSENLQSAVNSKKRESNQYSVSYLSCHLMLVVKYREQIFDDLLNKVISEIRYRQTKLV